MTRELPDIEALAVRNPGLDAERLFTLEKRLARLIKMAEEPTQYRVEPPLGELVTVSGQRLLGLATRG